MPRLHLFEVEDLNACPRSIRDALTDYLQFVQEKGRPYDGVAPTLRRILDQLGQTQILDLCSGGGGPWRSLLPLLNEGRAVPIHVTLTDRHPNQATRERFAGMPGLTVATDPVDATAIPHDAVGLRTMFTSFHHFAPREAGQILADAVTARSGIAIFEVTQRSMPALLGMLLVPAMVLLATPFIRPLRGSRFLWTYIVPVVPLLALWDGLVSCLRTYTPAELRSLVRRIDAPDYRWHIGEMRVPRVLGGLTYLIGTPTPPTR